MTYEAFPGGPFPARTHLRGIINSIAPQWLKWIAQAQLDFADDVSRSGQVPLAPWVLPSLQPQLPPGNGQPSIPCYFCDAIEHRRWCITQMPTRGYTLVSLKVPQMPSDWPGYPPDHPRMRPAGGALRHVLTEANLSITVRLWPTEDERYGSLYSPQALAAHMFGRINPHWYLDGSGE